MSDAEETIRRGQQTVLFSLGNQHEKEFIDMKRRLAAWEPVVRAALAWQRGAGSDGAFYEDIRALWAALDAIPDDLLPGGE